MIEETERLNFVLVSAKDDKRNLVELYEKLDKDRRKLQERNARLTVTGNFSSSFGHINNFIAYKFIVLLLYVRNNLQQFKFSINDSFL